MPDSGSRRGCCPRDQRPSQPRGPRRLCPRPGRGENVGVSEPGRRARFRPAERRRGRAGGQAALPSASGVAHPPFRASPAQRARSHMAAWILPCLQETDAPRSGDFAAARAPRGPPPLSLSVLHPMSLYLSPRGADLTERRLPSSPVPDPPRPSYLLLPKEPPRT